jgi:hypothetical protein
MYSGTTLTPFSGNIVGAHQKLDRVARRHLERLGIDENIFPTAWRIIHFEGHKGPDAIKRKSPAKDEPWHFYSPFDDNDSQIFGLINDHYAALVRELTNGNPERVAFEAAWLAHAVVDGLTPAHHYPYEAKLEEIWGHGIEGRNTAKLKWFPPGDSRREKLTKTWKVWGPKGLISVHSMFELGVAAIIAPLSMKEAVPSIDDLNLVKEIGPLGWFKRTAREIAVLDMYDRFRKRGWSTKLVYDVRHKLGPSISKAVAVIWYQALVDAGLVE